MIVRHDPGELFESALDGAASLGVVDPQGRGHFAGITHLDWRAAGAEPSAAYVNTGVLLMDLERWRSLRLTEQCTTMIERHGASFEYSDQDAINLAHAAMPTPAMGVTDPRWNVHAWVLRFAEIGETMYDPETLRRTIEDPWIIHYTNSPKPWRRGCTHPWQHEFYDALDRTDWSGWRVSWRTDAIPTVRRAVTRLRRRVARSSR